MTWFRVDDGFAFHPKAVAAGNSALGLWVRAGAWSAKFRTDGALPGHMIGTLGAQARDARRLVQSGLWTATDVGYQFNDWERYQLTKAQLEADRESAKERMRKLREAESSAEHDPNEQRTNGARSPDVLVSVPILSSSVVKEGLPLQVADAHATATTMIQNRLKTSPSVAAAVAQAIEERFAPRNLANYLTRIPDDELRKLMPTTGNQPPKPHEMCDHGRHRDFCPFCKTEAAAG